MPTVYIHPNTRQQLEKIAVNLPQSLLIAGPPGVGLKSSISFIAETLHIKPIYIEPEKEDRVDLEKGVISVDMIRRLYGMTKTIETGTRFIIIDYAERMSIAAQNAFLKLLEEPGTNTHFALLTHTVSKLLPTVRSRLQLLEMQPVTPKQSNDLLAELKVSDTQKQAQLLFIAAGLPALMISLARDNKAFEARAQIVRDARAYLQGTVYERFKVALKYKETRAEALLMLSDAGKLLESSIQNGQGRDVIKKIETLLKTYERIEANGNVRLQLASGVIQ